MAGGQKLFFFCERALPPILTVKRSWALHKSRALFYMPTRKIRDYVAPNLLIRFAPGAIVVHSATNIIFCEFN